MPEWGANIGGRVFGSQRAGGKRQWDNVPLFDKFFTLGRLDGSRRDLLTELKSSPL